MSLFSSMQEASNKNVLIGVIAVAALVFGGLVWAIMQTPSSTPTPTGTISFDDANEPFVGPENATTVVRFYSDFQCPACRAAEASARYAIDKYRDRVKFVWKDFPLMSIHPNARPAANAARCAQDQGKFWEMKDLLFEQQASWKNSRNSNEDFKAYASRLGLDVERFTTCLDGRTFDDRVMETYEEGVRNGVDRTPTVFIGDERRFGMTPAEWDQVLANRP